MTEKREQPPRGEGRSADRRYETPVDRAIREAVERGEFDNLPGSGKPLKNLGDPNDAMWWVRGLAEREQLDFTGALPPAIALRKEAATFPESLLDLRSEGSVREVLEDYNRRVKQDRLRPPEPGMPQLLAPTVDIDDLVAQWRDLKAASEATRAEGAGTADAGAPHTPARWWRRWRRR